MSNICQLVSPPTPSLPPSLPGLGFVFLPCSPGRRQVSRRCQKPSAAYSAGLRRPEYRSDNSPSLGVLSPPPHYEHPPPFVYSLRIYLINTQFVLFRSVYIRVFKGPTVRARALSASVRMWRSSLRREMEEFLPSLKTSISPLGPVMPLWYVSRLLSSALQKCADVLWVRADMLP